jgi:hypothetical protein
MTAVSTEKEAFIAWGGGELGLHPKGRGVGGALGYTNALGLLPIPYGSVDIGGPEYGFQMGAVPDPESEIGLSPMIGARFGHPRKSGITRQFPRGLPEVIYDKLRGRTKEDAIRASYPDLEEDRAERAAKKKAKKSPKAGDTAKAEKREERMDKEKEASSCNSSHRAKKKKKKDVSKQAMLIVEKVATYRKQRAMNKAAIDRAIKSIVLEKIAKGRCWDGYEPVPGKKAYSDGSCQPAGSKKKKKKSEKAAFDASKITPAPKIPSQNPSPKVPPVQPGTRLPNGPNNRDLKTRINMQNFTLSNSGDQRAYQDARQDARNFKGKVERLNRNQQGNQANAADTLYSKGLQAAVPAMNMYGRTLGGRRGVDPAAHSNRALVNALTRPGQGLAHLGSGYASGILAGMLGRGE